MSGHNIVDELDALSELTDLEKEASIFSPFKRLFKKGPTLESRRAAAEAFHAGQKDTLRGTYIDRSNMKVEAPKKPASPELDRSNMQVSNATTKEPINAAPDTTPEAPTKWYKDRKIMKGVGIGAVGAAGVGLGAHMLSNKQQNQNQGNTGYY